MILCVRENPSEITGCRYVRFDANAKIQAASIKIAGYLAERDPRFVYLLLQYPKETRHLVYDYTLCLNAGLFGMVEDVSVSGTDLKDAEVETCAGLILRVIRGNAEKEYPNFMHVLLGYNTSGVRSCT